MKLILLKDGGSARSVRLSRHRIIAGAAGVLVAVLIATLSGYLLARSTAVSMDDHEAARSVWQGQLSAQRQEIETLKHSAAATSQALGRQLARMQARLMRMEAIGSRMIEVADIDADEFTFAEEAPQGGPSPRNEVAVPLSTLKQELNALSSDMSDREREFTVLDSVLTHSKYYSSKVIAGRPITWGWMSSPYGYRVDPISGKRAWHAGVDFAGKAGSDVIAVASGIVTFAGYRGGYGNLVEISHGDGYTTRYGHHESLAVKTGDLVKKGQVIGAMGSSGRSTGPHVHFEVLKNGRTLDPAKYVAQRR
ncbi:MAG: M23 family metallopeptidase [Pseudomonadota bacterium]